MSYPAAKQPRVPARFLAAGACAFVGVVIFQFFGNAARGYVDTPSVFWWWVSQWLDPQAESQHGWFILAVSGWLFWRNLKAAPPRSLDAAAGPLWPAALALGAALALHAVGFAAQFTRASIVAVLLFTWGVLRLAGGRRWGRAAIFPLGFLLFSVPLNVLDEVGLPLRLWVVAAGDKIAHAAGVAVLRSGTQLLAPDGRFNYDVAAACSGVRSLLALSALAVLLGYLSFRSGWRRALVALACLPLVYLGNVVRIVAIIFAAQWGGQVWGNRAHAVMGWGVFAIVLGGVLGAASLIQRWLPERSSPPSLPSEPASSAETFPVPASAPSPSRAALWLLTGGLTLIAVAEIALTTSLRRTPPTGAAGVALTPDGRNPVELPAFLGVEWVGRPAEVTAVERAVLPSDTGFSRKVYVPTADVRRQVLLSIVLSGRDRTSIHRPELCLVGQGWTITGKSEHPFTAPAGAFPATVLHLQSEVSSAAGPRVVPSLVAYWFVNADTIVATHPQRLLRDIWNRLAHGRVDRWAYVLLQADATDGEAAALARMQAVLSGTWPAFQRVTPSMR